MTHEVGIFTNVWCLVAGGEGAAGGGGEGDERAEREPAQGYRGPEGGHSQAKVSYHTLSFEKTTG